MLNLCIASNMKKRVTIRSAEGKPECFSFFLLLKAMVQLPFFYVSSGAIC